LLLYALYTIFILACIVLIISVLLQPGKADAGALFTSSVSSTTFGPRGTQTLLAKITIGSTIVFMLVALMLALGVGRPRSVLESAAPEQTTTQPTPAATVAPPQTGASPANATASPAAASPQGATTPAEGAASPAAPAASNTNTAATPAPASSPQAQASPR
jgi:preprotein translocase subunit SecG